MKLISLVTMIFIFSLSATAATFNVNSTVDTQDAIPGDGVCADRKSLCTLRAAITESNNWPGVDTIVLPPNSTFTQALSAPHENNNAGGDWDILDNTAITGGPATIQATIPAIYVGERTLDIPNQFAIVALYNIHVTNGYAAGPSEATRRGGGINNLGDLYLYNVVVSANYAFNGGGIYTEGPLRLENSFVSANECVNINAACYGGGILGYMRPNLGIQLINTKLQYNNANDANSRSGHGGGIAVHGQAAFSTTISGGDVYGNKGGSLDGVGSSGGGIRIAPTNGAATLNISNVRIAGHSFGNGSGAGRGAGISLETSGTGSISGDLYRVNLNRNPGNNSTQGPSIEGGNLSLYALGGGISITVRNSNFYGGEAKRGGAVAIKNSGANAATSFNATNSSFVSNGHSTASGGGVYIRRVTSATAAINATFNFCTLSQNRASQGGAMYNDPLYAGAVTIANSIIDYHASSTDILGAATSGGYNNFDTTNSGVTLMGSDAIGNAGLVFGPGSEYMVPLTTSPVINTIPNNTNGCNALVNNDQLLNPRPFNAACDKGAIELQQFGQGFWE